MNATTASAPSSQSRAPYLARASSASRVRRSSWSPASIDEALAAPYASQLGAGPAAVGAIFGAYALGTAVGMLLVAHTWL